MTDSLPGGRYGAMIRQHLSAEDDMKSIKNCKSAEKYGADDSDDNIDNSHFSQSTEMYKWSDDMDVTTDWLWKPSFDASIQYWAMNTEKYASSSSNKLNYVTFFIKETQCVTIVL